MEIGLHRQNRRVEPTLAPPQRGNFRRANLRHDHQVRNEFLDPPQNRAATPPKDPARRRRPVHLALPAFKKLPPQPGSVAQHPPIRLDVDPMEPAAGVIKGINDFDLDGIAPVIKRPLHGFRCAQMSRTHAKR